MALKLIKTEEIVEDGVTYVIETYKSDKTGRKSTVKFPQENEDDYAERELEQPIGGEPTQAIKDVQEGQLVIMEAMAAQYEEALERDLINMEVQATIYEELLAINGKL